MAEELIAVLENAMRYENGITSTLKDLETACARRWSHWNEASHRDSLPDFTREADYWQRCWDIVTAALRAASTMRS